MQSCAVIVSDKEIKASRRRRQVVLRVLRSWVRQLPVVWVCDLQVFFVSDTDSAMHHGVRNG